MPRPTRSSRSRAPSSTEAGRRGAVALVRAVCGGEGRAAGAGGFRVHYGAYDHIAWLKGCVGKHEQSHIHDFQRDAPNSCKNPDGTPVCDGERAGDHISFTKPGTDPGEWQRKSECTAPHVGLK